MRILIYLIITGYDSYDEDEKAEELERIRRNRGKSCRPQKAVTAHARQFSRRVRVVAVKPMVTVNPDEIEDEEERNRVIELQVQTENRRIELPDQ